MIKAVDTGEVQSLSTKRTTAYRYDAHGSVQTVAIEPGDDSGAEIQPLPQPQPDGMKTLFIRFGRDANGQVNRIAYDSTFVASQDERALQIFYEGLDQIFPTRVVNPLGHTFRMATHSGLGVRATIADAEGRTSQLRYDSFGRLKQIAPSGGDTQTLKYASFGAPNSNRPTLEMRRSSKSGAAARARMDNLNRAIQLVSYDRDDGRGVQTNTTFDAWGHVVRRSLPFFETTGPSAFDTFAYDNLGRATRAVSADGSVRAMNYRGRQTDSYDAEPTDPAAIRVTSTTDLGGRLLSSLQHVPAFADRPARDLIMSYAFGPYGTLNEVVPLESAALKTGYTYDRRGRQLSVADPTRGQHQYVYDVFGQLESESITKAAATTTETRRYAYDVLGRPLKATTRDGETGFTWDTSPSGIGQLATTTSPDGVSTAFAYDLFGRPSKRTWTIGGEPFAVATDYDANGLVQRLAYPDKSGRGFAIEYTRGTHGSLQSIADASSKKPYWTNLETDAAGAATNASGAFPRVQLGNGIVSELLEDPALRGRQRAARASIGTQIVQSLTYALDPKRNLRERRDDTNGVLETFDYDEVNRLYEWKSDGRSARYDYDDRGGLQRQAHQPNVADSVTYAYEQTGGAGPYAVTGASGATSFTFDAEGNQLVGPHGRIVANALGLPKTIETSTGAYDFAYDAFGARVERKLGTTEQLITLDALYERRSQPTATQLFRVHGPQGAIVEVTRPTSGTGPDVIRYLHRDNLGSVVGLSDETGKVVERRRYDPFGNLIGFTLLGTPTNPCGSAGVCDQVYRSRLAAEHATTSPLGFSGHRTDIELGLVDMVNRIYSPRLARFLSPDPLAGPGAVPAESNPYAYVLNNPASYIDPFGLEWEDPRPGDSDPPPSPSPTPPGPWTQPSNDPSPSPGSDSTWTVPRAPYNPVNEIDNRAAAAKIDYRQAGFSTVVGFSGERISPFDDQLQTMMSSRAQGRWQNPAQSRGRGLQISQLPPNRVFADRSGWGGVCDWIVDNPHKARALVFSGAVVVATAGYAAYTLTLPYAASSSIRMATDSTLPRWATFGIQPYARLRLSLAGLGLQAHHLLEGRFSKLLGQNP